MTCFHCQRPSQGTGHLSAHNHQPGKPIIGEVTQGNQSECHYQGNSHRNRTGHPQSHPAQSTTQQQSGGHQRQCLQPPGRPPQPVAVHQIQKRGELDFNATDGFSGPARVRSAEFIFVRFAAGYRCFRRCADEYDLTPEIIRRPVQREPVTQPGRYAIATVVAQPPFLQVFAQ